ncbi:protein of unknown function [Dyadobacter soli]|uniref:Uncharacterized protein n=1 Tax=Dyadobacter soli TaxID=659014 RepID=A0A1G7SI51_9BACT|nr:DUF4374 domain-containing protein [Dyadobacter soli]SDG22746.1 protein of unknown function [Dyadobacter soli]
MGVWQKSGLLAGSLITLLTFSYGPERDRTSESHYILALSQPAQGYYPFQIVSDLETGEADIRDAKQVPDVPNNVLVAARPGYVFLNSEEKMTRYSVAADQSLKAEGSVPNTGLLGGPISAFLDDNRLLVSTAPRQVSDSLFDYQIINTADMTEERRGKIRLDVMPGSMASPSMYIVRGDKVLVPYIHADDQNHAYPKANLAIFNAKDMVLEKTISTEKTACLGYSVVSSHAFTDNGDLYLISSNSHYWGANESLPSGIVRMKSGETEFDSTYFFNLTAQLNGNHSGGMIHAGGDKVIVQVFENNLIKAYRDYQHGYVISYYEADLKNQSLRKLDIPLSKYPRRALERLKNGKVAIAVNAGNSENAFYIYDGRTGQVKKGLVYRNAEFLSGVIAF